MDPIARDALWILALPLGAFAVQIFLGRRLPRQGDWVSLAAIFACLALSVRILARVLASGGSGVSASWEWIRVGGFALFAGLRVDGLTAVMLVVVTLVSALVHLYSVGYMRGDPRYSRYFAYLGIFSFSMLGLVLVESLLFLFVFWELVGLCSYLLIGFWFEKPAASDAAKKAFLVNRVGDVGFFIGILIVFALTGELAYGRVFEAAGRSDASGVLWTVAGVCLFAGAVGKSAQFPLHVWLPDAMEGPTPVSALIHAATMVAAGVYMVARLFPILTPEALAVVATTGAVTAVLAASIALAQNDIKKVLAYSTVSQLGFMVLALGAGGYLAGLFHLVTHAAFKACLFLGSGSVIHAVHTQDIQRMGGLSRRMPVTYWTFLVATLAIAGLPFVTSGFFSKDMIIAQCFERAFADGGGWRVLPWVVVATAGLTAFYMFRLVALVFWGSPRDAHAFEHAHESPAVMTAPLVVLAALSLSPVFGVGPKGLSGVLAGEGWLQELVRQPQKALPGESLGEGAGVQACAHRAHVWTLASAIPVALAGMFLGGYLYGARPEIPARVSQRAAWLHRCLVNKWYFDELYQSTVVAWTLGLARLGKRFDQSVIDRAVDGAGKGTVRTADRTGEFDNAAVDGAVNGVGLAAFFSGQFLKLAQSGRLQGYLAILAMGVGAILLGSKAWAWAALVPLAVVAFPVFWELLGGRDE